MAFASSCTFLFSSYTILSISPLIFSISPYHSTLGRWPLLCDTVGVFLRSCLWNTPKQPLFRCHSFKAIR